MSNEFIFVYGTLRKALAAPMHDVIARHCEYFADGFMYGKLYEVDGYPAAIESVGADETVQGELYRIISGEELLPVLDDYEECTEKYPQPHEYIRKKRLIRFADNETISAWVYVYNHDVSELIPIESGDYLDYFNGK